MIILIPSYEPDHKLVRLVASIREVAPDQTIVIVDDGSGPDYGEVFQTVRALGCDVIGHLVNRGKGFALKCGFAHIAERYPGSSVVCADCDGQHSLVDILRVATAVDALRFGMVLGSRQFVGEVPAKSRFGNTLTRSVFDMVTGLRIHDTQTGLRAYPAAMLPWLQSVPGDRFDYELELLLAANREGVPIVELPIETIYIEGNASSHFHPVWDSIRVYVPFLKFSLSSLTAFAVDTALFFTLMAATGQLAVSVLIARVVSATFNFGANRRLVFGDGDRRARDSARRYAALVAALMVANYGILRLLTGPMAVGLALSKFITEAGLFVVSYQVQRRSVFARRVRPAPHPAASANRPPMVTTQSRADAS